MEVLLDLLLAATALISATICTSPAEKHFAVTPLIGSEQFYLRTKKLREPVEGFESETLKMKTDICATILRSSPSASQQDLEVIDLYKDGVLEELKKTHPRVYERYFRKKSSKTNPYILRDITVQGLTLEERVFTCIARNRKSTSIVQYFISPEYNVNESTKKTSEEIRGRFVFANKEKKEMMLIALAEEPARKLAHAPDSVELLFQENLDSVEDKNCRVICDMSAFQKVRLCTSIVSAEDKAQLVVDKDYGAPKCKRRELNFAHHVELLYEDDYNQLWEPPEDHEEWMLDCKARQKIGNNETVIHYYVSRGFTHNKFFVAKEGDNGTVLESITSNVGVVPTIYA